MIQSDTLSRRPDFVPDVDNDNEDITMLPSDLFVTLIDTDLQQRIADCDALDKDATEALTTLLEQGPASVRNTLDDWTLEKFNGKNILFYKGKNYIPANESLRRDIVRMFHDHTTTGHPGELETYNSIRQYYWWPGLRTFVKKLRQRMWHLPTI